MSAPSGRYAETRQSLHGVAELLLAGPQRRATRSIKLTVTDHGFTTAALQRPPWRIGVQGTDLVLGEGDGGLVLPLRGTFAELAAHAGVACQPPSDAYPPSSGCGPTDVLHVDPASATRLLEALRVGQAACKAMASAHGRDGAGAPVLWPEHFDVAITLAAVNYGVSPGDQAIAEPYAYVGPHDVPAGDFWNQPFGAARPIGGFADAAAVVAFFEEGRAAAARPA
jgi:hypothetical protein